MQNLHTCLFAWCSKSLPCGRGKRARRRNASLTEINASKTTKILHNSATAIFASLVRCRDLMWQCVTSSTFVGFLPASWRPWRLYALCMWFSRDRHGFLWLFSNEIPCSPSPGEDYIWVFVLIILLKLHTYCRWENLRPDFLMYN